MRKIRNVIIHFAPLELYPPIQNFLNVLDNKVDRGQVVVITSKPVIDLPLFKTEKIKIIRRSTSNHRAGALKRSLNYAIFYLSCILLLTLYRPRRILYYETLSSFPAYLYQRFFNRKVQVYIHYHEYTSKEEYANGMVLARKFHQLEKQMYPRAAWVSHTNALRMEKFNQDISPFTIGRPRLLPNYPPAFWKGVTKSEIKLPVKIIYVGALSVETMYCTEFSEWIMRCKGDVVWDIYTLNYAQNAVDYISSLNSPWVSLKGGVDYSKLPAILAQYDIGVILYKGHIPNYIYNAPNKLFEYLACGLDVWFPIEMVGCYEYITKDSFPKVVGLDFESLNTLELTTVLSRDGLKDRPGRFYCEPVYEELYNDFIR